MALCSELGWLLDETYLWSRTFSAATAIFCGYAISQPYAG
ncbi:rod shape-determining MreC domain protein [Vibrio cholerae HC-47A1]|nr:rod shape-determining MreC domain protein [Vibrio cholerae HC-61A1]EJH36325.1 rod shape-determining MreC domain protein [Vibrio cholerae CP1038(11)]EJH48480.1 rod shape-determining MreC domain protein [Vibrio cholerae CP1048(21)]EJH85222.1 rod shape-determining MreC domain protein [Vibrio cholerae HC-47A1]ELT25939.1 rod shape-determining MreC domain protein [Vibrio cholerae HC-7A1]